MRQRQGSRLRFRGYRADRLGASGKADAKKPGGTGRSLWRLYRELFAMLGGHWLTVATALATLTVSTFLKLIPPASTKFVIDYVLLGKPIPAGMLRLVPWPSDPRARLGWAVAGVLIVAAIGTFIALWGRWLTTRASKRLQVEMRRRVYEHAVRLPLHRVYEIKSGGASSLLRDDAGGVGELLFSMIYNPWRAVVQLSCGLAVLAWVNIRLLLGSTLILPLLYAGDRLWNRRLRPLYRDVRKQRQEIDAQAAEVFGGMRVVRAFGRQRREASRFVAENHYMTRQELFAWWASRIVEIVWDLLLPGATAALMLYGGLRVLDGRLSLGDLMMFLVYLAMLLEPLAVLATGVTQLQNNLSGLDRVLDLLEEPRELADSPGSRTIRKADVAGRVSLQNLRFRYPGGSDDVIRGIDLEVEPGQVVALVGRSGAGKTTLCNLIARFHDPTEGVIRLDGVNLREIGAESYRRILGIVEQDVFLFDGSVADNIAYAAPASRAEVEAAARLAHAAEFIDAMKDGYDTVIGERGVKLSGGQRQRLAIARAVLADPKVLILDEATSNLDSESELLIRRGMETLLRGRTAFVIAHRLSTIRDADRILVLDRGRLVESGTHDDLIALGGAYRDMVELQNMGVED